MGDGTKGPVGVGGKQRKLEGRCKKGPAVRNGAREVHGPPFSNHSDRPSMYCGFWGRRSFGPEMQRTLCRCFMALVGVSVGSTAHMNMHATLAERWTPFTQKTIVLRVTARCNNSSKA